MPVTHSCPKGHLSSTEDYCSECGAKIQGAPPLVGLATSAPSSVGDRCPDCGTVREQKDIAFCEVCGFNFETGAHGDIGLAPGVSLEPISPEPAPTPHESAPASASPPTKWRAIISIDQTLRQPDSPEPPSDFQTLTLALVAPMQLIGRKDESRGILPDIALAFDEAISRRHAILQAEGDHGWTVRDIASANGTRLNGTEMEPMKDYVLQSGDEITLGHWTRIRVEAE